ncbi:CHAD domain-containing protein [Streptomyces iconiensis]|uniref:CHAD domain-containing protein n=1 Tax=Streptomyces iconiensis TaxID=1384038 RepID=A0ABT7A3F2_9ACTN|nr:CHAD domain-containing protein [Streptomyces iconiensis]MDJ1135860.1 CHAD domain-containing protein [Streptomyces iconiensis]
MVGQSRDSVVESGHGTEGTGATAADVLGGYLHARAAEFLRGLRAHAESAGSAESAAETAVAVETLRAAARRLNGALHTYRPLLDPAWADQLRTELSWLSGTLAREYAYAARLDRLLTALHRLASGARDGGPDRGTTTARAGAADRNGAGDRDGAGSKDGAGTRGGGDKGAGDKGGAGEKGGAGRKGVEGERGAERGALPVGAARAGALLDRQLTLSRTRAHSAALGALGSARFHAVADAVAVLASEVPFRRDTKETADRPAPGVLVPLAEQARRQLTEAVGGLPLTRAGAPYNAEALSRSLAAEARQDAAWHQVRVLLRLHRYALEVLGPHAEGDSRLVPACAALDRHREAAEAAAAAASAAATPRIAPASAYALGVLHADQRHEVEAARFAFGRLWGRTQVPSRAPSARGEAL